MTTSKIRRTVVIVWTTPAYVDILRELTSDTREECSRVAQFSYYSRVVQVLAGKLCIFSR